MRPDVRTYDQYRSFLSDYIAWMGQEDKRFSLRWIAQRAGFTSPSTLSMVINGKRALPRNKLTALADALKLLPDEIERFRLLFEMDLCDDQAQRTRIQDQLRRDQHFEDISLDGYEIYEHWYLPIIREMVELQDFKADPFWIAGKIGITPMEARDALFKLIQIGMIKQQESKLERSTPSLQPKQISDKAKARVQSYNRQLTQISQDAASWPTESRYFNSLTVSISKKTLDRIPELIRRLIIEIDQLAESDSTRDDVIQINVQMLNVTDVNRKHLTKKPSSKTLIGDTL
jgi:uncharacterized protein (TIGR02147 family)